MIAACRQVPVHLAPAPHYEGGEDQDPNAWGNGEDDYEDDSDEVTSDDGSVATSEVPLERPPSGAMLLTAACMLQSGDNVDIANPLLSAAGV